MPGTTFHVDRVWLLMNIVNAEEITEGTITPPPEVPVEMALVLMMTSAIWESGNQRTQMSTIRQLITPKSLVWFVYGVHSIKYSQTNPFQVSGTKRKHPDEQDASSSKPATELNAPMGHASAPPVIDGVSSLEIKTDVHLLRPNQRQEEIISLFQELSRLTNQTIEDAAQQARDDKKLKAYTELSSTLSQISPQGPTAVAPTLADILLRNVQSKQRTENNLKAITEIWNKVFTALMTDISRSVDFKLEEAVQKIGGAAEHAAAGLQFLTSTPKKKHGSRELDTQESTTAKVPRDHRSDFSFEPREMKEDDSDSSRQKRRCFSNISRSSSPRGSLGHSRIKMEQSMQEILNQMKNKIDEQAQTLQKLTKENNEVLFANCFDATMSELIESSTVPPSSPDSEDEFNTSQARIYFGPLKSPEKRFASNPVLPRRSPRLSTPQPRLPSPSPSPSTKQELTHDVSSHSQEEEHQATEAVDPTLSRACTPDVELVLQDEPPSALAIRISRAYDNPSPPPSLPIESCQLDTPHISFSPVPSLTSALLESASASDAEGPTPPMSSSATPGLSREISPVPTTPPDSSQHTDNPSSSTSTPNPPLFCETRQNDILESSPSSSPSSPKDPEVPSESLSDFPVIGSEVRIPEVEMAAFGTLQQERSEERSVSSLLMPDDEGKDVSAPTPPSTNAGSSDDTTPTPTQQQIARTPVVPQPQDDEAGMSSEQSDSDVHEETIRDEKSKRTMWKPTMNSPQKPAFIRELGSLSPSSNDLLGSLIARPSLPYASSSTRRPFPSSPLKGLPQTPKRTTGAVRFSSPSRSMARESNSTVLQTMSLDDPTFSPARRIPIEEAIAQGHVSPLKSSQFLASSARAGSDGKQKPFIIPPTDSPARRVVAPPEVATPVAQKRWQSMRFESPVRTSSRDESSIGPPAPQTFAHEISREPGGSSSHTSALGTNTTIRETRLSKLPFPLVPSPRKDLSATVPEEDRRDTIAASSSVMPIPTPSSSSPTKSNLKQTTSRIPRTLKPYARPNSKSGLEKSSSTARGTTSTTGSKTSETIFDRVLPSSRPNVTTGDTKSNVMTTIRKVETPQTTTLKRKHAAVETSSVSPVKPRSLVMLRQVPSVTPSAPSSSKATALVSTTTTAIQKKPQQIRRVIDKPVEMKAGSSTQVPPEMSQPLPPVQTIVPEVEMLDVVDVEEDDKDATDELASERPLPSSPDPIAEYIPANTLPPGGVRRTTRLRKPLIPSLTSDSSSDGKARRRVNAQTNTRSDTTYFGMSATALRALTTTNTVRNQRYLAAKLETEVIRRSGDRPESPAVKIQTVLQREQDAKGRERRERAVRRARLSGEDLDQEDRQSDSDDASDCDEHTKRHKRGAGDEEDYQTPVRKLKRLKLGDNDDEESMEKQRRVKWDRGLFTTVYLDEVKVGARQPSNNNSVAKGCLAPTAKTLQLDDHGNLPYADTPLSDLVEENIVVKKFVYDNDIEAAIEEVVVKNTRQRSKKGKT
ncbi:hypothetical protein H0H92_002667 [Tricholoma furcatifolium]|nr:hypothetical protein H0H92_002667 [Tricholoma furcatifolium]